MSIDQEPRPAELDGTAPIRVLLCDDDPFVRDALAAMLTTEPDLELVAVVASAEEALTAAEARSPAVVLMDLTLPGIDGIEATRRLRARAAPPAVIVLTSFGLEDQVREAVSAGACGFQLKTGGADALLGAIRAADAGAGTVLSPEVAAALVSRPTTAQTARESAMALALSEREVEVLRLICEARSNGHIAEELGLAESTVKSHVSSIMGKLRCHSRVQITLRAFERGLLAPPAVLDPDAPFD